MQKAEDEIYQDQFCQFSVKNESTLKFSESSGFFYHTVSILSQNWVLDSIINKSL